jgi:hypothetical protein
MKLKTLLEFDIDQRNDGKFFAYGHLHIPASYRTRDMETARKKPAEIFADTGGKGLTLFQGVTQISNKLSTELDNGLYYHKEEIVAVHDIELKAEYLVLEAFRQIVPDASREKINVSKEFIRRFLMEKHQWKFTPYNS